MVIFENAPQNYFLLKLTFVARFQFKNERGRRRTRGVIGPYFTVFILTQHGSSSISEAKVSHKVPMK